MGKGAKVVDVFIAVIRVHVGAAQSLTSEAYALAREQSVCLDDVDHEVLLDRLQLANRHLGAMLCAMSDDLDDWGDESAARVGELARRYRPFVRRRPDPRAYLVLLVRTASRRARYAHKMLAGSFRDPDSKVVRSMWTAAAHLEVAEVVLGVVRRRRLVIMESLAEHRQVVLDRRRPPGGGLSLAT